MRIYMHRLLTGPNTQSDPVSNIPLIAQSNLFDAVMIWCRDSDWNSEELGGALEMCDSCNVSAVRCAPLWPVDATVSDLYNRQFYWERLEKLEHSCFAHRYNARCIDTEFYSLPDIRNAAYDNSPSNLRKIHQATVGLPRANYVLPSGSFTKKCFEVLATNLGQWKISQPLKKDVIRPSYPYDIETLYYNLDGGYDDPPTQTMDNYMVYSDDSFDDRVPRMMAGY